MGKNNKKYTYEEVKKYIESLGYELISKNYKNNQTKLILKDIFGYYYTISLNKLKLNKKPRIVDKRNPYSIKNIKLWCKLNNKSFELVSKSYNKSDENLKWKCLNENCQEEFEIMWECIRQNIGCPYCSGVKVGLSNCLATKRPDLTKEWHPIKNNDLTPYDVTCGSNRKVWWLCSKNNKHEWKTEISSRNSKKGCPYCSGQLPSEDYNLLVINSELCKEWDYIKNKKKPEEYTPNSGQKVWWICKECEYEWEAEIRSRNNSTGCPICNESKGEKVVRKILEDKNKIFISQYIFDNLFSDLGNPLRFDFGVLDDNNNLKCLIEFDGKQHYEWISGMMTKKEFEKLQYHDQLKNIYCQKHNIPLFRIPYWEFDNIKNILENYLLNN